MSGGARGTHEDDDDALFDALANREPVPPEHADDPLVRTLSGWAAELDRDLPAAPALDPTLTARLAAGTLAYRLVRPAVAAAAAIAVLLGAGAVAVHNAEPGGLFWSVSRLVDPDRAASLEAREQAAECLTEAEQDLAAGRLDQARDRIAEARGEVAQVRLTDGRAVLDLRLAVLVRQLDAQIPHAAPPQAGRTSPPPGPAQTATTPSVPPGRSTRPPTTDPTAPPSTVPLPVTPPDKVDKAKKAKKKAKKSKRPKNLNPDY